jgi:hypothetical protein
VRLVAFALFAGSLSMFGCSPTDPKTCAAAKERIAKAVTTRDFARARALRAEAYGVCEDRKPLAALDMSIADGESNQAFNAAAQAQRDQAKDALVRIFLDFVKAHRSAPEQASNAPRCIELRKPTVPSPLGDGVSPDPAELCSARRQVGARHLIEIHYAEPDPSAFRFSMSVPGRLDCESVGGTEVKSWHVETPGGKPSRLSRCELGGPLSGLAAVVENAQLSSLHVFSASYLERVPGARKILDASGS